MPDHLTALGVLAALGIARAYVLSNDDPALAAGRDRAARRALARRLARRDARARAPDRAADVRLLPRPPRRRVRHRGDLHRPRAVAAHAAGDRPGDRRSRTCCSRSTRTWRRRRSGASTSATAGSGRPRSASCSTALNIALFARRRRSTPRCAASASPCSTSSASPSPRSWSPRSSSARRRTSACSPSASRPGGCGPPGPAPPTRRPRRLTMFGFMLVVAGFLAACAAIGAGVWWVTRSPLLGIVAGGAAPRARRARVRRGVRDGGRRVRGGPDRLRASWSGTTSCALLIAYMAGPAIVLSPATPCGAGQCPAPFEVVTGGHDAPAHLAERPGADDDLVAVGEPPLARKRSSRQPRGARLGARRSCPCRTGRPRSAPRR